MQQHSFSDFSYAVNKTSAKKGYKEILVCFIYNGTEVLRKLYIKEKEGTSYIFEAKKIIDQEMKSGVLASYSYKFVKRKEKKTSGVWKWVAITAGIGIVVATGMSVGMYFAGKAAGGTPIPGQYTVTFAGSRYNKAGNVETVKRGKTYECLDLKPTDANTYLNVHSISMGGKILTGDVDYTFDLDTYDLSITKPADGNIVITISGDSERIVIAEPNYKIAEDGHATVTGFKNSKKEVITDVNIPSIYVDENGEEHEVTEIAPKILNGCSNLKRLVVPFIGLNKEASPDATTFSHTIGSLFGITSYDKAYRAEQIYFKPEATEAEWIEFYIPWSLERISITNATSIPSGAFSGLTYVKEIYISSGTESNDFTHIGNCAFYKCANLIDVTYPQATVIEKFAFKGCSSLSHFDLTGVLEIDTNAFENCSGFSTLVVPSTVVEIQAGAFSGSIGGMIATDATKDNDDWEKGWCTAPIVYSAELEEDGTLKTYLDSTENWRYVIVGDDLDGNDLAYSAYIVRFEGQLETDGSITIPNEISTKENAATYTVRHLGSYVFNYNNHLNKVIFGTVSTNSESDILSIGNNCFEGCTNLTTIEGPGLAKIKTIGNYAFSGCSSLVIQDQYGTEATADNATFKALEQIGDFAFAECPSLKSFNLPVIKSFGQYSFYNCATLTGMKIYGDLKSLGEAMFYYDASFKTINLYLDSSSFNEEYYVDIPNLCFCRSGYCAGETMSISSWIKNIGYAAFAHCSFTGIEFATHQEGGVDVRKLETIGQEAFYGCNGLEDVTVPAGIKTFGSGVFGECKNLLKLTINSELTSIPQEFCYYCSKLQEFKFNGEIESIGSSAFMYDQSLITIKNGEKTDGYLPATLNSIGDAAFLNCSSISSLTLCYEEGKSTNLKFGTAVFGGWATKTVTAQYTTILFVTYNYQKDDSNYLRIQKGWLSQTYSQAGTNYTKFGWTLRSSSIYVGTLGDYLAMEKYVSDSAGNDKLSIHIVD